MSSERDMNPGSQRKLTLRESLIRKAQVPSQYIGELNRHLNKARQESINKIHGQTMAHMQKTDESGQSRFSATGLASAMTFGLGTPEHTARVKTRRGVRDVMNKQGLDKQGAIRVYAESQGKRDADERITDHIAAFLAGKKAEKKAAEVVASRGTAAERAAVAGVMRDISDAEKARQAQKAARGVDVRGELGHEGHGGGKKKTKKRKMNRKKAKTNKRKKPGRKSKTHKKRRYGRKSRRH